MHIFLANYHSLVAYQSSPDASAAGKPVCISSGWCCYPHVLHQFLFPSQRSLFFRVAFCGRVDCDNGPGIWIWLHILMKDCPRKDMPHHINGQIAILNLFKRSILFRSKSNHQFLKDLTVLPQTLASAPAFFLATKTQDCSRQASNKYVNYIAVQGQITTAHHISQFSAINLL